MRRHEIHFKPCMKSLKPNELHNYIYQSGPEDEAWKLPTGIDRLIIFDHPRRPTKLWILNTVYSNSISEIYLTKLTVHKQGLANEFKAEMNHVVEFTVSCFLHAIDPINVTMAYRATSLLLKDLILTVVFWFAQKHGKAVQNLDSISNIAPIDDVLSSLFNLTSHDPI